MKRFINEIKYLNKNMSYTTRLIILIIIGYFLYSLKNIFFNPILLAYILILLFSLLIHEIAHGFMAYLFGDNTAKRYGRLSLNPLHHLDPLGTIFPIMMILSGSSLVIGWAKPVPINYYNLRHGRFGEFCVAIAGVLSNILLAIIGVTIFKYGYEYLDNSILLAMVIYLIRLNLLLAIFNIIPIPPLDGSRVLASIGSNDLRNNIFYMDKYGIIIILILSWTGLLYNFINPVFSFLLNFLDKIL